MNASKNIVRLLSTTAARAEVAPGYAQIRNTQAKFQVKDGKPVHLKGGTTDKILYQATAVLSLCGLGGIFKLIFDLSK